MKRACMRERDGHSKSKRDRVRDKYIYEYIYKYRKVAERGRESKDT